VVVGYLVNLFLDDCPAVDEMADRNKHPLRKARMERMKAQELDANSGQTSPIPLAYNTTWLLIGNITIGTPPQTLQVAFDLYEEDLYVTDVNAVLYNPWTSSSSSAENTPVVPRFDSSASTTYLATNQNFSEWGHISGKFASDIVNLGGLDVNLTFGDANQIAYYIDTLPIAGFFGLSLHSSYNNVSNVLRQLLPSLNKPIVALNSRNGSAEVAFGTDSLDTCATNWQYVPYTNKTVYGEMGFHLSAVSTNLNGCQNTVKVNHSIILEASYYTTIYTSYQVLELFVQASGAYYNNSAYGYQVPCDQVANSANVSLTIGDGTQTIVLSPFDYISQNSYYNACYLSVHAYYDENNSYNSQNTIYLGQNFLNNHCLAFNLQDQTVGFANVLAGQ